MVLLGPTENIRREVGVGEMKVGVACILKVGFFFSIIVSNLVLMRLSQK